MGAEGRGERLWFLDWLRVAAVFGVFVFHTLRPFDDSDWHVKNEQTSSGIAIVIAFLGLWGLAFFFMISGAAALLALRWRTAAGFLRERAVRLLVPFVVAYVVLSPLQYYIEQHHKGRSTQSFLGDVRTFFGDLGGDAPLWLRDTYHLWFLVYLIQFAVLGLPLFLFLRGVLQRGVLQRGPVQRGPVQRGPVQRDPVQRGRAGWIARWYPRRGSILLLAVPLIPVHLLLLAAPGPEHGWGEFVFFFDFFVVGYVVMSDKRLLAAVRRDAVAGLVLGAGAFVLGVATGIIDFLDGWWAEPGYSWKYLWYSPLITVAVWGWLVAVLGFGLRAPALQRPLPPTLARIAMPYFIVHQPVILAIAYFIVRWNTGIAPKYAALLLTTAATSTATAWCLSSIPHIAQLCGVKPTTPQPRHQHPPT